MVGNAKENTDFKDITIDGVKALFPEFGGAPLISGNSSGEPAYRLIENDDLLESLKVVYFPTLEHAHNVRDALAECFSARLLATNKEDLKAVDERINWIKIHCATMCSLNALFADEFKQTAIKVATTASTEKGFKMMQMPLGRRSSEDENVKGKSGGRKP
jgi:hypothetical protein